MNVSAKTEYACIAVLELSLKHGSGRPVKIRDIADVHGIPARFLVQILIQLKGAGIVGSTRGVAGGYQLARDPGKMTLGEVFSAMEGPLSEPASNAAKETAASRIVLEAWREMARLERDTLNATTFADLVDRVRGQAETMYYI